MRQIPHNTAVPFVLGADPAARRSPDDMASDAAGTDRRRAAGGLFGPRSRHVLELCLQPFIRTLHSFGVKPDAVTWFSLVPALAAGWLAAEGRIAWAGAAFLLAGLCDFIDGRLARHFGPTRSGALLDSVLDRYVECCFLTGAAWHYRQSWIGAAVVMLICGSLLVPYIRARGEGLGLTSTTGFMQRPERIVLLGLAALLSPWVDFGLNSATLSSEPLFALCLIFLAVTSHGTAWSRLRHAVRSLREADDAS